jgi:CubicO group peptidase (beta-lactamase class C family)
MRTNTITIVLLSFFAVALNAQVNEKVEQSIYNGASTEVLNIDTWQKGLRGEGLGRIYEIIPNLMAVNAQDVYPLNFQAADYELHEIKSVARIIAHPGVSSFIVIHKDGDVLLEHYKNEHDRGSIFSDQSSTKSMGYLLLRQALKEGKLSLDDKVEKYVPSIGPGFQGRSVGDVASMAVNHNVAELAAYTGDPAALEMFNRDERVIGLQRNDERETIKQFIQDIDVAPGSETNVWDGEIASYAAINTSILGLIVEAAMGISLANQVRNILHKVGGENTIYMGTDFDGLPIIGASLVSSTIDFARYGRLLIEDEEGVLADREKSKKDGQTVPAELTFVEGRYYKSAIQNEYGIGHSGWGGQILWADPESGIIIAGNSQLKSELPAPYDHFRKLYEAAYDIVKLYRSKEQ